MYPRKSVDANGHKYGTIRFVSTVQETGEIMLPSATPTLQHASLFIFSADLMTWHPAKIGAAGSIRQREHFAIVPRPLRQIAPVVWERTGVPAALATLKKRQKLEVIG